MPRAVTQPTLRQRSSPLRKHYTAGTSNSISAQANPKLDTRQQYLKLGGVLVVSALIFVAWKNLHAEKPPRTESTTSEKENDKKIPKPAGLTLPDNLLQRLHDVDSSLRTGNGDLKHAAQVYDEVIQKVKTLEATSGSTGVSKTRVPPEVFYNAAITWHDLGDNTKARRYYNDALARLPITAVQRRADVHINLAHIAVDERDSTESVLQWTKAVELKPNDAALHHALGSALVAVGQPDSAVPHFLQAAELDPRAPRHRFAVGSAILQGAEIPTDELKDDIDGRRKQAQVHFDAAFNVAGTPELFHELGLHAWEQHLTDEALRFMLKALETCKTPLHARSIVYATGRLMGELSASDPSMNAEEERLYASALARDVIVDVRQRPVFLLRQLTPATPWPSQRILQQLQPVVALVEGMHEELKAEIVGRLYEHEPLAPDDHRGFVFDSEALALNAPNATKRLSEDAAVDNGRWKQGVLVRDGKPWPGASTEFPVTSRLVNALPSVGQSIDMPKQAIEISVLGEDTHIRPHCGPTNHRLRLHLGIQIPTGATITVAGETRQWKEGKVLVIDDSWEHEVHNTGPGARIVLIVDVWHPDVTEELKEAVRMAYAQGNSGKVFMRGDDKH
eukprot:m.288225 g.288225  ORF g.288225 m.288225 type:complete len:621 (+) comp19957_c0_seq2:127-1989(+)